MKNKAKFKLNYFCISGFPFANCLDILQVKNEIKH